MVGIVKFYRGTVTLDCVVVVFGCEVGVAFSCEEIIKWDHIEWDVRRGPSGREFAMYEGLKFDFWDGDIRR